jgi:hypothetical protein
MIAKPRLPFQKIKFDLCDLCKLVQVTHYDHDLDLVQMIVHTKFGDPMSTPVGVIVLKV